MLLPETPSSLVTIRHQGVVISFYLQKNSSGNLGALIYRTMDPEPGLPSQEEQWSEFRELEIPGVLRMLGYASISYPQNDSVIQYYLTIKVISIGDTIYLFRHTVMKNALLGSITVNRFRLVELLSKKNELIDSSANLTDRQAEEEVKLVKQYAIEPLWEVRFQNSSYKYSPIGDSDQVSYKNKFNQPFYEPTLLFSPIQGSMEGVFDVQLFDTSNPAEKRWHIYVSAEQSYQSNDYIGLNVYYLDYTDDGLFGFPEPDSLIVNYMEPSRVVLFSASNPNNEPSPRNIRFGISASMYATQEKIPVVLSGDESNESKLKRQVRVMLCFPMSVNTDIGEQSAIAAGYIDFAITGEGFLAPIRNGGDPLSLVSLDHTGIGDDGNLIGGGVLPVLNPNRVNKALTVRGAILRNTSSNSQRVDFMIDAPLILAGNDGYLHFYYSNANNDLTMMQFDTSVQRSDCSISLPDAGSSQLIFESRDIAGDQRTPSVSLTHPRVLLQDNVSTTYTLTGWYNLTAFNETGQQETWKYLPRNLMNLVKAFNGKGVDNPADNTDILNGSDTFFSAQGRRNFFAIPAVAPSDIPDSLNRGSIALIPNFYRYHLTNNTKVIFSYDSDPLDVCNPYASATLELNCELDPWDKLTQQTIPQSYLPCATVDTLNYSIWSDATSFYRMNLQSRQTKQWELPSGFSPSDIVVDNRNRIWLSSSIPSSNYQVVHAFAVREESPDKCYSIANITQHQFEGFGINSAMVERIAYDPIENLLWLAGRNVTENAENSQLFVGAWNPSLERFSDIPMLPNNVKSAPDYHIFGLTIDDNGLVCVVFGKTGALSSNNDSYDNQAYAYNPRCKGWTSSIDLNIEALSSSKQRFSTSGMPSPRPGLFVIATNGGPYLLDFSRSALVQVPNSDSGDVRAVSFDARRSVLWIGYRNTSNTIQRIAFDRINDHWSQDSYWDTSLTVLTNRVSEQPIAALASSDQVQLLCISTPSSSNAINQIDSDVWILNEAAFGKYKEIWAKLPVDASLLTTILQGKANGPSGGAFPYLFNNASGFRWKDSAFEKITGDEGLAGGSVLFTVLNIDAVGALEEGTYPWSNSLTQRGTSLGASEILSTHLVNVGDDHLDVDLVIAGTTVQSEPGRIGKSPHFLAAPVDQWSFLNGPKLGTDLTHTYLLSTPANTLQSLKITGDITVEMWLKPSLLPRPEDGNQTLIMTTDNSHPEYGSISVGLKPSNYNCQFNRLGPMDFIRLPSYSLPSAFTVEFWASLTSFPSSSDKMTIFAIETPLTQQQRLVVSWSDKYKIRIIIDDIDKGFDFSDYIKKYFTNSTNRHLNAPFRYRVSVVPNEGDLKKVDVAMTLVIQNQPSKTISNQFSLPNAYLGISGTDGICSIGQDYSQFRTDDFFAGCLQELRIWGKSLTPLDTASNDQWSSPYLTGEEEGLLAYYPMREGPGATVLQDCSGHGYHGFFMSQQFSWNEGFLETTTEQAGLYAIAGDASGMVLTGQAPIVKDTWQHLGARFTMGYSIDTTQASINCGSNDSLNPESAMTITAQVCLSSFNPNNRNVIVSKNGPNENGSSYEFFVNEQGYLSALFSLAAAGNTPSVIVQVTSLTVLPINRWVNVAVTFVSTGELTLESNQLINNIGWEATLYIEGQVEAVVTDAIRSFGTQVPRITPSESSFIIGAKQNSSDQVCLFQGRVSSVSLWNRALSWYEITHYALFNTSPSDFQGLVSYWNMSEGENVSIHDRVGSNAGILSDDSAWRTNPRDGQWTLLLNGEPIVMVNEGNAEFNETVSNNVTLASFEPFGITNGTLLCGANSLNTNRIQYYGKIDEVRLWSKARTIEEISYYTTRPLAKNQIGLQWYLSFDGPIENNGLQANQTRGIYFNSTDSTWMVCDQSSNKLNPWVTHATTVSDLDFIASGGPITTEAPIGVFTLSSDPYSTDYEHYSLESAPSVIEYGDLVLQEDLSVSHGVMKRLYLNILPNTSVAKDTTYVVGELDVLYVAQAQMAPSIVGYIEGAPPVPSENLTVMERSPKPDDYTGTASVELAHSKDTIYSFSASRNSGFNLELDTKLGRLGSTSTDVGLFIAKKLEDGKETIAAHGKLQHALNILRGAATSATLSSNKSVILEVVGAFEQLAAVEPIGRRYIPGNVGYALVRSGTADLYGLRLKDTGALVGYEMVPNPDIPIDWNILIFPINDAYTKNGTLDGMVGFSADPAYPAAPMGNRGSYFKPKEAYELKGQIERQDKQLESVYEQFNATHIGQRMIGKSGYHYDGQDPGNQLGDIKSSLPSVSELGYDMKQAKPKHSLTNTYVWTADGGLFQEAQEFATARTESFGGGYELSGALGIYTDFEYSISKVGVKAELDLLFGGHLNVEVNKSEAQGQSFGLDIAVEGEGFLNKRKAGDAGNIVNDGATYPYSNELQAGKVRGYRFNSYFLSPRKEYFTDFFNQVIDDEWLRYSNDPDAAALRRAKSHRNGVWKILHRVTYVSRVLPEDTDYWSKSEKPQAQWVPERELVAENNWLIDAVENVTSPIVSPRAPNLIVIGKSVDNLLGHTLVQRDPGWKQYWENSANNSENQTLRNRLVFFLQRHYGISEAPV